MANVDLLSYILVGIAGLLIGALLGSIISYVIASREEKTKDGTDLQETVRILQNRRDGSLTLEVEGRSYQEVGQMSVSQFKRLRYNVEQVLRWLDLSDLESPAVQTYRTLPEDVTQKEYLTSNKNDLGSEIKTAETPSDNQDDDRQVKPVRTSLSQSILRILRPKKSRSHTQPVSIAAQVDGILQGKLSRSKLKSKWIRVMELPDMGVAVKIGDEIFEGVESVPDEEVRNLIQECVEEWGSKVEQEIQQELHRK